MTEGEKHIDDSEFLFEELIAVTEEAAERNSGLRRPIRRDDDDETEEERSENRRIANRIDSELAASLAEMDGTSNKDAEVRVERTTDDLRAMIQLFPPVGRGKPVTVPLIKKALYDAKVTYGIDMAAIERAVAESQYLRPVQVALGKAPIDGQDAQIIYHYTKNHQKQDSSLANLKRIDYKELDLIINVEKDDVLIEKIPATMGESGISVRGKPLRQRRGKDIRLRGGKGVRADESGLKFYSTSRGQVIFRNSEIRVEPIYETEAVDARTGNIRFIGSVVVNSIVEDGYTIDATGDIRIGGEVGASTIKSDGDITIGGGLLGGGRAQITSNHGDVYCKFIQDATVTAGGDIFIEEYCKNAKVRAAGKVALTSEKPERGFIMGGETFAVSQVICNNVGNGMNVRTLVSAGVDGRALEELSKLRLDIKKRTKKVDRIQKFLTYLQSMRSKHKLDKKRLRLLFELLKALVEMRVQNSTDLDRFQELLIKCQSDTKAYIRVRRDCHSESQLTINGRPYANKKLLNNVLFKVKDGEVKPILL